MIKPWVFEFFPAPANPAHDAGPEAAAVHFAAYLDLWQRTEALGFEGIFFSEHHFGPAYSPSPNLLIAALAPRTRTLRLGVMGMVLPYYQPWRVVEEIGMLDHLTGGRLEVGTSSGIPQEMALINLDVAAASERNAEAQAIIDAGLRDGVVNHHGKHWQIENFATGASAVSASVTAQVDDGGQHGIRTQIGAARHQDMHQFPPCRAHPRDLRCVSR